MKAIDIENILPGDIILTARPDKLGASIRRVTRGKVSHAMICVQSASFIDSTMNGVQASNIQRELFEDDEHVFQFRLREPAQAETIARIVDYARSEVGARYATTDVAQFLSPVRSRPSTRQFCSRLVARAYASAGIQLLADTDYCSPEDLRNSPLLKEIPISTRPVSAEEIEWRRLEPDSISATHAAQNQILRAARSLDHDVETMQDVIRLVMRDLRADAVIDDVQKSSGFLDLWRVEVDSYPWRYRKGLIEEKGPEDREWIRKYCLATVREGYTGGQRFSQNLSILALAHASHPRKTLQSQIALYQILELNHQDRREIAYDWLAANFPDQLALHMEQIEPYSDLWFHMVEPVNPAVAADARTSMEASDFEASCSVCSLDHGDRYRLANAAQTLRGVPSLRLCHDCLSIRASRGEVWIPFLPRD